MRTYRRNRHLDPTSNYQDLGPLGRIVYWVLLVKGLVFWIVIFAIGLVCIAAGNTLARVIGVVLIVPSAIGAVALVRRPR